MGVPVPSSPLRVYPITPARRVAGYTGVTPLQTLRVYLVPPAAALNERAYSTARSPKMTQSF